MIPKIKLLLHLKIVALASLSYGCFKKRECCELDHSKCLVYIIIVKTLFSQRYSYPPLLKIPRTIFPHSLSTHIVKVQPEAFIEGVIIREGNYKELTWVQTKSLFQKNTGSSPLLPFPSPLLSPSPPPLLFPSLPLFSLFFLLSTKIVSSP